LQETSSLYEHLEERLRFEQLLAEISSEFANLPASSVDETIVSGLQRIGQFMGAERCSLVRDWGDAKLRNIYHSWQAKGIQPLPAFQTPFIKLCPWMSRELKQGQVVQFTQPEDLPDEAAADKAVFQQLGTKSHVSVPISVGGVVKGAISIGTFNVFRTWPQELIQRLRLFGEVFVNSLERKEKELEIRNAWGEIKRLKDQLEADYIYLREECDINHSVHNMIGESDIFRKLLSRIGQIAAVNTTVLLLGETGTGKELVARAIHAASSRRHRPMVRVNCASLPSTLIESELFGHEKGAFTGAHARKAGRFELANGSTLFLDEIGELPLESQAKLLRVIQEGEFERLGGTRTTKVDVRIIGATNRNLEEEVKQGRFRQDLWYRLNVFPIEIPPLRERREDVPLLVNWFVGKFSREMEKEIQRVPSRVIRTLQRYGWPGNIRELQNVIERAVIITQGADLQLADTLEAAPGAEAATEGKLTLEENERNHIVQVLEETAGRIDGSRGAALILGINPSTLRSRMRKLGIQRV